MLVSVGLRTGSTSSGSKAHVLLHTCPEHTPSAPVGAKGPGTREGTPGCICTSVELQAIPELGTFLFHIRKNGTVSASCSSRDYWELKNTSPGGKGMSRRAVPRVAVTHYNTLFVASLSAA